MGIADLIITELDKRLSEKQLHVVVTDKAKELIADRGYDPVFGARPLKRFIQSNIETLLARKIISEDLAPGTILTVDCENGEIVVKI